jgi:RND family efflux transporter MFP subunit
MGNSNKLKTIIAVFLRLAIVFAIIITGLLIAKKIIDTAPKAKQKQHLERVSTVKCKTFKKGNYQVKISALGIVEPSESVEIVPEVSGRIIKVNPKFTEGGVLKKGDFLFQIDPEDYEIMVSDMNNKVQQAQSALELELGQQELARIQLKSMNNGKIDENNYALALRKPHLKEVEASLKLAKNELRKAELALSRTRISMPFDGIILQKAVGLGSFVSTQKSIAVVANSNTFWARLLIDDRYLGWFQLPDLNGKGGAKVVLNYAKSSYCPGTVFKLLKEVDEKGKMLKILVEVESPLTQKVPLLLNEFVKAKIDGKELKDIYRVPRALVHNGNNIWLNNNGRMKIEQVDVIWTNKDFAFFKYDKAKELKLVETNLSLPANGLKLNEIKE